MDSMILAEPANVGLAPGTTIAVTGATGFVGGRLVEQLAQAGCHVICLIRGTDAGMRLHRAGAHIRQVDLSDAAAVRDALQDVSIVFHLAYDWGNTEWNFTALRALIEGCRANRCERLVHCSSFVVYDIPDDGEVCEHSKPNSSTGGYAHTKLALETELLRAVKEDGLPATIIQPTIIYGPHSRPWTLDPADMLRHGTVVLPAGSAGCCNAVYVDDVVSAMILAATRPQAIGQRYLISGPSTVTWNIFYESIARAIGADGPQYQPAEQIALTHSKLGKLRQFAGNPHSAIHRALQIGPLRKLAGVALRALPGRLRQGAQNRWMAPTPQRHGHVHLPSPGHLQFLQGRATISTAKARDELGYQPVFDLEDGMSPTAQFLNEVYFKRNAHG